MLVFALVYWALARFGIGQFTVQPLFLACHYVYGHIWFMAPLLIAMALFPARFMAQMAYTLLSCSYSVRRCLESIFHL